MFVLLGVEQQHLMRACGPAKSSYRRPSGSNLHTRQISYGCLNLSKFLRDDAATHGQTRTRRHIHNLPGFPWCPRLRESRLLAMWCSRLECPAVPSVGERRCLGRPRCAKRLTARLLEIDPALRISSALMRQLGSLRSAAPTRDRSPINRSICLRPSPTKP